MSRKLVLPVKGSIPIVNGRKRNKLLVRILHNLDIYIIILIPLLVLVVYHYLPMLGIVIAFKNYKIFDGIIGSKWIGLQNFQKLLSDAKFYSVLGNTLIINLYKLAFQFPIPIILALLLNEVRRSWFKRWVQTLTYLPHFLSYVVIAGIFIDMLSPSTGIVNAFIKSLGFEPITFLGDERYFRGVLVASHAWKESGWSAIVYLSALTAIDSEIYDAASVDGAGRLKQTWYITLPGISSTIVFVMILRAANAFASDTEQVLLFYNPLVYRVGDVLGTYVYREGIQNASFSYTTAVGIFTGLAGTLMMLIAQKISVKYTNKGLW
jgi:putative aldouronate transport system permease protein